MLLHNLRPRCSSVSLSQLIVSLSSLLFFNATAATEIYTLSLHDALPIWSGRRRRRARRGARAGTARRCSRYGAACGWLPTRSEEHTSELQSLTNLVCRLLLEKKKKK